MLTKDRSNIYFTINDSISGVLSQLISFLADDINFLFLDTTNSKGVVSKELVNYCNIDNDADITKVIDSNRRNLDHIILFIPLSYKAHYIPRMKKVLDDAEVPYSIITSSFNYDNSKYWLFDSVYFSHNRKEIKKDDELITYDSFTTQYIRLARINDIINNSD